MVPAQATAILRFAKLRNEISENFSINAEIIRRQRELPYAKMWQIAYSEGWHHIRFEDLSILQFQSNPSPSYHFIECPLAVPPLSEFVKERGFDYRDRYKSSVQEEYELVIDTASLRSHVTPIRYDYDVHGYREGVHPVGHLHIGLENEIRLRMDREMTPLAFLLFIIRQRYPVNWEHLINSPLGARLETFIRRSLVAIGPAYCKPLDQLEVKLS